MHYLYSSTVNYLPQFIAIAQKTGKQLMIFGGSECAAFVRWLGGSEVMFI
jgi:hypothetical protein